ncbi:MAG: hypothetical protein ACKO96_05665, partial [Flammeovirgaceae bacterium]
MVGIIQGDTDDAVRSLSRHTVSKSAIARWATEQATLLDATKYLEQDLVNICADLVKAGGDVPNLPFGVLGGKFRPWPDFQKVISEYREILIPVTKRDYINKMSFSDIGKIGPLY